MKIRIGIILACSFTSVFAQSNDVAAIEEQLAAARQELNVVLHRSPPRDPLVNMPGESNSDRAQRHASAIKLAQESWVAEWSARNPFKFSNAAPKMPSEMERQAIRQSDTQALAQYKARTAQTPDPEVANLHKKIASLEKKLTAQRKNVKAPVVESRKAATKQKRIADNWESIKVGMNQSEVKALLGKPNGSTKNRWIYVNAGTVDFDEKGFVVAVDE